MKIRSMTAIFGKLDRARLELGDGLNLICAPNEGGKSTWCAFWQAMLYGFDTRERDRKGHLAEKNRYQPWSGAPMAGELEVEWRGRDITIRRGPKNGAPFAAFSAVYTGTEEPVPGLTADTCGELLTGVGREVFQRSAFLGSGGDLSVTAAPELERRIAALVSSGQEDVSFSQTQARLREWLNRRRVNKSVGQIPKLEQELSQVEEQAEALSALCGEIARLEETVRTLERERADALSRLRRSRQAAQNQLDQTRQEARSALDEAREQLEQLEQYGPLPPKDRLKQAQGELQYLKVLEEEIRQAEADHKAAEDHYVQTQIAIQDQHFPGLTGEEALAQVHKDLDQHRCCLARAKKKALWAKLLPLLGLLAAAGSGAAGYFVQKQPVGLPLAAGAAVFVLTLIFSGVCRSKARGLKDRGEKILARYGVGDPDALLPLAEDYQARRRAADQAAEQLKAVRGALNDRRARRENSQADLLRFARSFAPQVSSLFGVSAALSRALGLDHEAELARQRVAERRRRLDDLPQQAGGAAVQDDPALTRTAARLDQARQALDQALGRQAALGDPAALCARREQLQQQLEQRRQEHQALTLALSALEQANARLQERFSPALNRLAGEYLSRLTGQRYRRVSFTRELEGSAATANDLSPRSALSLSRGTADQLYLSLRLAVCRLCLPEKPPIVLDDALAAFDDQRLGYALDLLRELAEEQQILLFTCHRREGTLLAGDPAVKQLTLQT